MDLDITSKKKENGSARARLLDIIDRLADERSDSYVDAIRNCLVIDYDIKKALKAHKTDSKDVESAIRKILYKKVIRKLEVSLAESIPRRADKRQRSESPPSTRYERGDHKKRFKSIVMQTGETEPRGTNFELKRPQIALLPPPPPPQPPVQRHDMVIPAIGQYYGHRNHDSVQGYSYLGMASPLNHLQKQQLEILPLNSYNVSTTSRQSLSAVSSSYRQTSQRPCHRGEFEIAIICALPLEYDSVIYLFDELWDKNGDLYGRVPGDPNHYTTGRIGKYNVILALLQNMGKVNAASATASMRSSYSGLQLILLVGVCGAVPHSGKTEILLGDVIISKSVIQYDFGRQHPHKFVRKDNISDNLRLPNNDIRNFLVIFETNHGLESLEQRTSYFLQHIQSKVNQTNHRGKYDPPERAQDRLFRSTYRHKHHTSSTCLCHSDDGDLNHVCDEALNSSCAELGCNDTYLVPRNRLEATCESKKHNYHTIQPRVHVGPIASGDTVMKSAIHRDRISREEGIIAFEMEGAGVWDEVPSIVVKGVCDYADSHKNKNWQNYAAAIAAAAAKAILERYIQTDK